MENLKTFLSWAMWEVEYKIGDFCHQTFFLSFQRAASQLYTYMALEAGFNMTVQTLHMCSVVSSWMSQIENPSPEHNEKAP